MFDRSSADNALLHGMLQDFRTSAATYCRTEVAQDWGIALPREPGVRFHYLARGSCWLRPEDGQPIPLGAGDAALLPHGTGHIISAARDGAARTVAEIGARAVTESEFRIDIGPPGAGALLQCCTVTFAHSMAARVIAAMPGVLVLRHGTHQGGRALSALLAIMSEELEADRPGADAIRARLADTVISMMLRDWAETAPERPAWLKPLAHPGLLRVFEALRAEPQRIWTIPSMARLAGMSRTTFIERFTALTGSTPGDYVAQARRELAGQLLQEAVPLAEIARRTGYSSVSAFSRAWRNWAGRPPRDSRRASLYR